MSAAETLLLRLEGVRKKQAGGWMARCPAHEDRSPSLSIDERDGTLLLNCFAGCGTADVLAAMGLSLGDLFERRPEDAPCRPRRRRPALTVRDALDALDHERLTVLAIAHDMRQGVTPSPDDLARLAAAGRRLQRIKEICA